MTDNRKPTARVRLAKALDRVDVAKKKATEAEARATEAVKGGVSYAAQTQENAGLAQNAAAVVTGLLERRRGRQTGPNPLVLALTLVDQLVNLAEENAKLADEAAGEEG